MGVVLISSFSPNSQTNIKITPQENIYKTLNDFFDMRESLNYEKNDQNTNIETIVNRNAEFSDEIDSMDSESNLSLSNNTQISSNIKPLTPKQNNNLYSSPSTIYSTIQQMNRPPIWRSVLG